MNQAKYNYYNHFFQIKENDSIFFRVITNNIAEWETSSSKQSAESFKVHTFWESKKIWKKIPTH